MSNQNTKSMGAARTGKRYDETFKLDAVRLRQPSLPGSVGGALRHWPITPGCGPNSNT